MAACAEKTKVGRRCKNPPMAGRDVCKQHSGDANVGRPTRLSDSLVEEIAGYIRLGVPAKYAAEASGVSSTAFYAWKERGEADLEQDVESLHADFARSLTRARAEFLSRMAALVTKHAAGFRRQDGKQHEGDWRAAAWLLERRGDGEWREKVELEHGGSVRTEPIEVPADDDRLSEVTGILREIGVLPNEGGSR
jgi:hypothetical protein